MERASQKLLPPGYTFEWTSTVLQQQQAGFAMPLAVLFRSRLR
jgi:multidrug efflux pump subunit AcrB